MGPVSIGVEVQRNTDGDTPSSLCLDSFHSPIIWTQNDLALSIYIEILIFSLYFSTMFFVSFFTFYFFEKKKEIK